MITKDNYYNKIKELDFSKLDEDMNEMKVQVDNITNKGTDWTAYENNSTVKETFDLYFQALELEWESAIKTKASNKPRFKKGDLLISKDGFYHLVQSKVAKSKNPFRYNTISSKRGEKTMNQSEDNFEYALFEETHPLMILDKTSSQYKKALDELLNRVSITKEKHTPKKSIKKKSASQVAYEKANKVERISDELKIIKRYVLMHEKTKTQHQIRLFINYLQRAIIEKRITKNSEFAKEIQNIQEQLIKLYGRFKTEKESIQIRFGERERAKYLALIGRQAELYSVKFIKSFISLQGKLIENSKAKRLYNRIAKAINQTKLTKKDRYWNEIEHILSLLKSFVEKNETYGKLLVSSKELNGLNGILSECACEAIHGVQAVPKNTIMSSTDIVNLNFNKIGFTGKWKQLIGDPSEGFRAMIFGKPKMGKSYLAVEFAGYLARHHGMVLYVAKEEGIDDTLQKKLKDKDVAHPDLFISDYLPDDLSKFDFVFLDSVNKLGLEPESLDVLTQNNFPTSFIEVYQTTKQGNFRGGNAFQHDVDIVIEVPEKGRAVQYGRFNQGGELQIFNNQ